MDEPVTIRRLIDDPRDIVVLADMFVKEWPEHYRKNGSADAVKDLIAFTQTGTKIPVAFAAYVAGDPVGVMALKSQSIDTHRDLTPWAAAGCVKPGMRGQGIGSLLLEAVESYASGVGFTRIYGGTSTSDNLLTRAGWKLMDHTLQEGQRVNIYMKILDGD